MRKNIQRILVTAMAGALVLGSMTGCSRNVDGTKIVATINDEELKLGTISFMARYQQAQTAQMYEMYFGGTSNIWDTVADEETGETYGEQTVSEIMEQMEEMVLLRQHASDYEVEISEEEQAKIAEAAKAFMEANDEATITAIGTDQSCVEEALQLSYYQDKMHDPMVADVDTEVSDEEAAQTGITYVEVSKVSDDENAEEEEAAEDEQTDEEEAAQAQALAQGILDEVLGTADADMNAIATAADESLTATETNYDANPAEKEETEEEDSEEEEVEDDTVPQELKDAVANLKDGEVVPQLVETDDAYYVVRLDAVLDQEATDSEKETIVNDRQEEAYDALVQAWKDDSKINIDDKVLKTLTVRDNDKYSFKEVETEETEDVTSVDETTGTVEEAPVEEATGTVEEATPTDETTETPEEAAPTEAAE